MALKDAVKRELCNATKVYRKFAHHVCVMNKDHTGDHMCFCGSRWDAS
jgi:hypothetical protein